MNRRAKRTRMIVLAHLQLHGKKPPKRGRKLPPQRHPVHLARKYSRQLQGVLSKDKVREAFAPLIARLPQILERSAARRDAAGDGEQIRGLVALARQKLKSDVHPEAIDRLASDIFDETAAYQKNELGRQVRAAFGVDVLASDAGMAAKASDFISANVSLIRDLPDRTADEVEKRVMVGLQTGDLWSDLSDDLEEQFGFGERRAKVIARDQIGKAFGAINDERCTDLGIDSYIWRTSEDERVRPEHEAIDGEEFTFADGAPGEGNPGEPVCCFAGDTRVSAQAPIQKLYRRWYRGKRAVIETDDGRVLAATVNHPILTTRGWLAAQDVKVGDYVVEASNQCVESLVHDSQHGDPAFEQVFRALQPFGLAQLRDSGLSGFHGDATLDEKVEVVDVDWCLFVKRDRAFSQAFCDDVLALADDATSPLGDLYQRVFAAWLASDSCVCRLSKFATALGIGVTHSLEHRLATITRLHAVADKQSSNGRARDAALLRDCFDGCTSAEELERGLAIVLARVAGRLVDSTSASCHTASAQSLAEVVRTDAQLASNLLQAARGDHRLRSVKQVCCEDSWSGHVYNLQTESSWYVAQGLLVHNCRCSAEPVLDAILDDDDEESDDDGGDGPANDARVDAALARLDAAQQRVEATQRRLDEALQKLVEFRTDTKPAPVA